MKTTINCPMSGSTVTRFRELLTATLLLLGGVGLCQASSNVTVTAQNFLNSQVLLTLETNPVASSDCGVQSVTAPVEVSVLENGVLNTYKFLFWDVNAQLHTNATVKFQPICGAANSAVAVYLPLGGGCAGCPPPTTDSVYAYSLNDYKVIPGVTPIASASSGWTAGSTSVTTPSTIEAVPKLPPYGDFKAWDVLFSPYTTSSSLELTAPGQYVVGFYGYPDPDPCQTLRNELQACLADGLGTACIPIGKSVQMCQNTYGE